MSVTGPGTAVTVPGAAASSPAGPARGWRDDLVSGGVTMASVLASFAVVHGLRQVTDVPPQGPVLAVVLTLTLGRVLSRAHHDAALVAIEVPLLGVLATCAGWLVLREPWVGQPLLVLALALGALARRWSGWRRQAGRILTLPFLALLVTPVPQVDARSGPSLQVADLLWGAAIGAVAVASALAARWVLARSAPSIRPLPPAPPRRSRRRLDTGTRTAIQLLIALGAALGLGHLLFGAHWPWALLSAYLVMSGARGRGDVAHKAALRVLGATLGTVAATLVTVHGLPAGNRWLIVAVFAVMAAAVVLRRRSYAFWAAGVTAMIALVDGYYGTVTGRALPERVLGVLLGSALGLAVAWFVLPTRTRDVLRGYLAGCLAALTDDLDPAATGTAATGSALRLLDELAPTLRAHRRLTASSAMWSITSRVDRPDRRTRRADAPPHAMEAIVAMHHLVDELPHDALARRRLRRDVVRVRRAIVGRDDPSPAELPPDLAAVHLVLQATIGRGPSVAGEQGGRDGGPPLSTPGEP